MTRQALMSLKLVARQSMSAVSPRRHGFGIRLEDENARYLIDHVAMGRRV